MADKFRVGIMYFSAGTKVPVEAGCRTIGYTSYNDHYGQQVFWFETVDQFERHKREIFEMEGMNRPVPVFELLDQPAVVAPVATAPVAAMAPPPPPPPVLSAEGGPGDDLLAMLGERKIRIKDFAAEVNLSVETIQSIIAADPRFAPVVAGWVRRATFETV